MFNRRKFIKASALSAGLVALNKNTFANVAGQAVHAPDFEAVKGAAIIISTWDFGIAANKAGWEILSKGGKAIDAVEHAGWVPEADVKNSSVGYGGLPDRDGIVTLDACIMDEQGNCGAVLALEHIK
ncbi:MAG: glycosylasparaginase, partial [Sphingobacteriales bacterium]